MPKCAANKPQSAAMEKCAEVKAERDDHEKTVRKPKQELCLW